MRVIAGTHRGRTLAGPENDGTTRPITDRVKENLFNRLQSLGMLTPEEPGQAWSVVDIYCGSGSLGIECLSRGAERCLFIESDGTAYRQLEHNLEHFDLLDRAEALQTSATPAAWARGLAPESIRLAFVDPPYALSEDPDAARAVGRVLEAIAPALEPGGVALWRTAVEITPDAQPGYDGPESVSYGGMALHFFQIPLPEDDADAPYPEPGDAPAP
ncbi:MAG: RsmD family RNA methyltransferase [Planctomycetota bacterium]